MESKRWLLWEVKITEQEADQEFADALASIGKRNCPSCGRLLDRGDVSWNNGRTEAGTEFTWAQIICQECSAMVVNWDSWYSGAEYWTEFVENVLPDLG